LQSRSIFLKIVHIFGLFIIIAFLIGPRPSTAQPLSDIPAWLKAHIGDGDGQIAPVVLLRARSLHLQKLREGAVRNDCYFAMDATRPNDSGGGVGRRFYIICEADHAFRAIAAGHGGGLDLRGVADFANGRRCAKNFGNAMGSDLTAGGAYVTGETKTSFKGYYRAAGHNAVLIRSFIQFDGQGETANAREREIGGHATEKLAGLCLMRDPGSPYADHNGFVPFGQLVDYSGGRSNGCTSWSPSDASRVIAMVRNNPTSLYIYPDAADIRAVARTKAAGQSPSRAGLYWNASCLSEIGAPRFWTEDSLGSLIARFKRDHPPPPPRPIPLCRGQ
jgi:hypothetical protein